MDSGTVLLSLFILPKMDKTSHAEHHGKILNSIGVSCAIIGIVESGVKSACEPFESAHKSGMNLGDRNYCLLQIAVSDINSLPYDP
jgi:hypothetical protein